MPSNPSNISSNPIFNGTNNKIANNYYNNNNINENSNSQQNPILINKSDIFNFSKSNPIINTPELVKTTERTLADVKPRKIFQNAENSKTNRESKINENKTFLGKNCKNISSSVGSKAFLKNFDYPQQNLAPKNHKLSYVSKENIIANANIQGNFLSCKNKNQENKEKITNKSIEIAPQEINNDLDKYLKTEIDVTPKSKKTAKVGILSLN